MGKLTVEDVLKAQIRSHANLDESKNCDTCANDETDACHDCINSFMGIVFKPSNYSPQPHQEEE